MGKIRSWYEWIEIWVLLYNWLNSYLGSPLYIYFVKTTEPLLVYFSHTKPLLAVPFLNNTFHIQTLSLPPILRNLPTTFTLLLCLWHSAASWCKCFAFQTCLWLTNGIPTTPGICAHAGFFGLFRRVYWTFNLSDLLYVLEVCSTLRNISRCRSFFFYKTFTVTTSTAKKIICK